MTQFRVSRSSDPSSASPLSVDIEDLAALQAFIIKHGRVIIDTADDGSWSIEIYDDYRE